MKTLLTIFASVTLCIPVKAQTSIHIDFNGLSPEQYSPFIHNTFADHGIQNPERGFEVKAGVIDVYTSDFVPNSDYDYNFMQYQLKGDTYYENIVNGDPSLGISPLGDYLNANFCKDGISLVEIEEYVHFTKNNLNTLEPIRSQDIINATSVFETLPLLGVKAHLVTNSSYQIFNGLPSNSTNFNPHYIADYFSHSTANSFPNGSHTKGLRYYMDQMNGHYNSISPFVANVHLGWIYAPHDRNMYRHSGKWQKSSLANYLIYPIGFEEINQNAIHYFGGNVNFLKNEHGDFRESKQKFDWSIVHGRADAWNYNSTINKTRGMVIDKMLNAFPYQKILLSSMSPWSNYLGLKYPGISTMYQQAPILEPAFHNFYAGNYTNAPSTYNLLLTNDQLKKQRIGYYDGAFGGDTYSHTWSIGNGETQQIHWHRLYYNYGDMNTNMVHLGTDWCDSKMNVDSYILRKYRQNLWIHGELPTFETTDVDCNGYGSFYNSFSAKYRGNYHWLDNCNAIGGIKQYPWELAEQMSDGRLQNGFKSALKMRYFNFTSFNISHNNLLDNRSPYELKHGQQYTLYQPYPYAHINLDYLSDTIPLRSNTTITQWKNNNPDLYNLLNTFHMPISDGYFGEDNTFTRSPYEYIRDHLGYRLELQEADFLFDAFNIGVHTKIINRGFSAPQNPRTFYFVLLNYNTNEIIQTIPSNADWRTWQPDDFATGLDNQEDPIGYTVNSIDDTNSIAHTNVGGIPLGNYKTDWHHSPLPIPYSPFEYSCSPISNFNLGNLPNGDYKIGIWAPDIDHNLHSEPKYNVKFANQLSYIHSSGINIIGSIQKTNNGIQASTDIDADGIINNEDNSPYNPVNYNGGHNLESSNPCFGFQESTLNQPCNLY